MFHPFQQQQANIYQKTGNIFVDCNIVMVEALVEKYESGCFWAETFTVSNSFTRWFCSNHNVTHCIFLLIA